MFEEDNEGLNIVPFISDVVELNQEQVSKPEDKTDERVVSTKVTLPQFCVQDTAQNPGVLL